MGRYWADKGQILAAMGRYRWMHAYGILFFLKTVLRVLRVEPIKKPIYHICLTGFDERMRFRRGLKYQSLMETAMQLLTRPLNRLA